MSGIKELPAEERAVLQLALRQARPFRDLAGLLDTDEAEMRRRAHAALEALGPDEADDLDAGRREQIGDWLLGQQTDDDRAETERFLAGSAAGRGWARVVADQLRDLGAPGLPEIPPAARADGSRADGDGAGAGVSAAAPSPAEVAAASAPAAPTPAEPALPAAPVGAGAMTPPGAPAAAEAAAAAPE